MTTATQARDTAMAQVEATANEQWKKACRSVIEDICTALGFGETFTTDLVWECLALHHPNATTHEPRAMGSIMGKAARDGLIRKTDQWKESTRVECHARPVMVWKVQKTVFK